MLQSKIRKSVVALAVCLMSLVSNSQASAQTPAGRVPLGVFARLSNAGGAVITGVQQDSVADDLGLQRGDVILTINGQLINDLSAIRPAMDLSPMQVQLVYFSVAQGVYLQTTANLGQVFFNRVDAPGRSPAPAKRVVAKNVQKREISGPRRR